MIQSKKNKVLTIGIIGGGQSARMFVQAGHRLGINIAVLDNEAASPAGNIANLEFSKGWNSPEEIEKFVNACDFITIEKEFIDISILEEISKKVRLIPSIELIKIVRDKLNQKQIFMEKGLPVPVFRQISTYNDAIEFGKRYNYPIVLKLRQYGNRGYSSSIVFREDECKSAWVHLTDNRHDENIMAETFIDFSKEIAVVVARNESGENEVYPCVETIQYRHICHAVVAPAEIPQALRKKAQEIALAAVEAVNGIGIFGVEMLLGKDNAIYLNELTPRLHNSCHYSIEACYTSQFENCIRAICNLPLGSSGMITSAAAMVNILGKAKGDGIPKNTLDAFRHKKVWLHFYNKRESDIGRKMGHVTAFGSTQEEALKRAQSAVEAIQF